MFSLQTVSEIEINFVYNILGICNSLLSFSLVLLHVYFLDQFMAQRTSAGQI